MRRTPNSSEIAIWAVADALEKEALRLVVPKYKLVTAFARGQLKASRRIKDELLLLTGAWPPKGPRRRLTVVK